MTLRLKISSALRLVIVMVAVMSVGAYVLWGQAHPYFDAVSLALMVLFAMVLYAFSGGFSSAYPPVIIVTLLLVLFVQLRTLVLIVIPDSLLNSGSVTSEMVNATLGYIICGTIACYLGFALGYGRIKKAARPVTKNTNRNNFRYLITSAGFLISLVLTLMIYFTLGYSGTTGSGAGQGFFQRYVSRLIEPDAWLIIVVTAYFMGERKRGRSWSFMAILALYFLSFMLRGSRAGLFEILILWLAAKLLIDNNFYIRLNFPRLLLATCSIPIVFAAYGISTQLRELRYGREGLTISYFTNYFSSKEFIASATDAVSGVSYRLSFIEPTMFPMFTEQLRLNNISRLVNAKTTLQSSINRLIPGKPLGNILFSEYAFGYMYNAETGILAYSENGRVDHVGYEWSMFGISYQLFGRVGGVIFIFLFTAFLGKIVGGFRKSGRFYGYVFGLYFLTIVALWIRNLGIDNMTDAAVHGFVVLGIYAIGLSLFTGSFKMRVARLKPQPMASCPPLSP